MKKLDIDFARQVAPYPSWLRLGLLLSGLVLLGLLSYVGKQTQHNIAAQNALLQAKQPAVSYKPDPRLDEALAAASRTQQSLQMPWLQMLANLEAVKAQHSEIKLLSVMPNREKAEIIVTGEAKQFDAITAFLEDLKKNPQFVDAALQNQHLLEPENGGAPIYSFNAQLAWRLDTMEAK